ncbi:peptidylprolyl isomerase [Candidatus Kaiserbacteria bacterium]|nr:MAG: peptidylprolyl isomerase [Candidatus Kaiserbacteria bacterium]
MSPEENTNEPIAEVEAVDDAIDLTGPLTAVLETSMGNITIELNTTDAPNTVKNFATLAREGFYDGTKFHRVIAGFMIQGGDPLSKEDSQAASWGTGGPGYSFADEIHANNQNDVGTIAMANSGPDTNGSQFFINVSGNNFLDDKHTVFGSVVEGMDIVAAIENTPVGQSDRPTDAVVVTSITIK